MHRFITLVWNPEDLKRGAAAREIGERIRKTLPAWESALDDAGLCVFHNITRSPASRLYILRHGAGVVLGTLFRKDSISGPVAEGDLGPEETEQIVESGASRLTTRYWGRYIAILRGKTPGAVLVMRDPSSAFPCFTFCDRGLHVFASHMEDVFRLDRFSFAVDWDNVACHLHFNRMGPRATGLVSVSEVLPGECIEIDQDKAQRRSLWHPAPYCREPAFEDAAEAARALKETTQTCISMWSAAYGNIVHELSGGLDSSIVLACLAAAPMRPALLCTHIFTNRPEGDERRYAWLAAASVGCELREMELDPSGAPLERMLTIPNMERPHISMIGMAIEDAYRDLAQKSRAEAFFSGQGGDHLFHQRKTPLVAADYVRLHGLGWRLPRIIADTVRCTGLPIWAVLWAAISHGLLRFQPPLYGADRGTSFVNPALLDSLRDADVDHPWLASCRDVPPAKRLHLADLINLQSYYYSFGRAEVADLVFPLFSQPLLELCLSIPCYVLVAGGQDRALARRAFADIVPAPILAREAKGEITHFYIALLMRELAFIRELLLDGLLAQQGLVDRSQLERHLHEDRIQRGDRLIEILICAGVEAWARRWCASSGKAAI